MIVDQLLVFSDAQELSADAESTNSIDLGQEKPTPGFSKLLYLAVTINEDVTGDLVVKLQDSADDSDYADVAISATYSDPEAGQVILVPVPLSTQQYIRAYYSGATAGTVSAVLTWGRQAWEAVEQAETANVPVA